MISRYRVSLDGVQMDSLDDNLLILDVAHSEPDMKYNQIRVANLDGYDYVSPYSEKTTVTISFELHIYDISKRNEACQKVNAWAMAGGTLTVNDRENQQLVHVKCEKYASVSSVRGWTDPLTVVLSTTYIPYWQSVEKKTLSLSGKSSKGTLRMDGNIGKALVSAEITANADVTWVNVTVGSTFIKLKGITLATNSKLVIDYVNDRFLRIKAGGKSVLAQLSADSSDNLQATCGLNVSVSIDASNKVSSIVTARGLWL